MTRSRAVLPSTVLALLGAVAIPGMARAGEDDTSPRRDVLRAQVLLERAHFASGEIDGRAGENFRRALAGFQRSRGLADDGVPGPRTWAELDDAAVPTLVDYTLTEADVAGPFEAMPEDIEERAELPALGYASIEEALAERFRMSPALLRRLNPDADFEQAGTTLRVPNVADVPALPAPARIEVSAARGTVTLFDGEDRALAQFPASTGSERDPLPLGDWEITTVSTDPVYHYNPDLFWDAEPDAERAVLQPGPNNPVGSAWIGLSKPHYGIHGTPEPAHVGKTESHGCIRLTNWSARALAEVVRPGLAVVLVE